MKRFTWFALGVLARALSVVFEQYAGWMLRKVVDGVEVSAGFLDDLYDFAGWFVQQLARYFRGVPVEPAYGDEEAELEQHWR